MTEIIIPMKNLADAKLRLAKILPPSQRASLVMAMLEDVLRQVTKLDQGCVWVVSSDENVLELANQFGAIPLREVRSIGYNKAILTWVNAQSVESNIAIIPGDIPLASEAELLGLIAPHTDTSSCIRIAPAHNYEGTNGLFLSSSRLIQPAFGPGSFARHSTLARLIDLDPVVMNAPTLALDIDTPDDLRLLAEQNPEGATGEFLRNAMPSIDLLTSEHVA